MRIRITSLLFALPLALASAPAFSQTSNQAAAPIHTQTTLPPAVAKIKIPPLHEFKPAQPRRIALPNGAVIFLIEDHELPLVEFTALFRGGSRDEPASKIGLADIYGDVWRTGGTANQTGDQMDDLLEARAAKLETASGAELMTISGDCLKQDFDLVFKQMMELIDHPAFREDKIDLAKQQMDAGISRRNDDAAAIAQRESLFLAYGKNNPYARVAQYATVAAITRADLVHWHQQYVVANNMIFGIAGDFDGAQMEARLRQALGAIPKGPAYQAPTIKFEEPRPGIYFVEKNDVNQSQIRMVALGTERKNPDYFALQVMNEAFGGGFASRLFSRIRTAQGLAYGVGGGYGAAYDHPGIFEISTSTKSGTTVKAIQSLSTEVDNVTKEPFTAAEVDRARESLLNQFIFRYDSKDKVLREQLVLAFYGYPADFLERYHDAIEKMTPADVNRVARKYVHRAELAVLVVGNSKDFDKNLDTFGAVTPLDIAIPEPAASAAAQAEQPRQSTPEAKALLAKALAFYGGTDKLAAVRSISYKQVIKVAQPAIEMTAQSAAILPDRVHQVMTTPQGEITTIISPAASAMQMGANYRPLPKSVSDEYLNGLRRTPYLVARHANDPAYIFSLSSDAPRQINGRRAQALEISGGGEHFSWLVDPQSGEPLGEEYQGRGQTGPVTRLETYQSFTTVDGIKIPSSIVFSENQKPAATVTIEDYKINPPLDPAMFTAPVAAPAPK
ncbi:MAG: insulinase family protein [Acidobacteriaceae bacterium]